MNNNSSKLVKDAPQAYAVSNTAVFKSAKAYGLGVGSNKGARFPDYRKMLFARGGQLACRKNKKYAILGDAFYKGFFGKDFIDGDYISAISEDRHSMNIIGNHALNSIFLKDKVGKPRLHHTTYNLPFIGNTSDSDALIAHSLRVMEDLERIAAERCVDAKAFSTNSHPVVFFTEGAKVNWYTFGYDVVVVCPDFIKNKKFDNSYPIVVLANPYNPYSGNWIDIAISGTITGFDARETSALRDKVITYLSLMTKTSNWVNVQSHHESCPGSGHPESSPVNKGVVNAVVASDMIDPSVNLAKVDFTEGDLYTMFLHAESPKTTIDPVTGMFNLPYARNSAGMPRPVILATDKNLAMSDPKFAPMLAEFECKNQAVMEFPDMFTYLSIAYSFVDPNNDKSKPFYDAIDKGSRLITKGMYKAFDVTGLGALIKGASSGSGSSRTASDPDSRNAFESDALVAAHDAVRDEAYN